jgi:hypothetical protein
MQALPPIAFQSEPFVHIDILRIEMQDEVFTIRYGRIPGVPSIAGQGISFKYGVALVVLGEGLREELGGQLILRKLGKAQQLVLRKPGETKVRRKCETAVINRIDYETLHYLVVKALIYGSHREIVSGRPSPMVTDRALNKPESR